MIIDQSEIDALLAANPQPDAGTTGARAASPGAEQSSVAAAPRPSQADSAVAPPRAGTSAAAPGSAGVAENPLNRILRIRVPVIVQLCNRRLPISRLRRLSVGTIMEFEREVEAPLELLINNRPIATGEAVRIGEHFGLRIAAIRDTAARIRMLGE